MCAGAAAWAQVRRVVFGADEPKVGYRRHGHLLHPRAEVVGGVLAGECAALLRGVLRPQAPPYLAAFEWPP